MKDVQEEIRKFRPRYKYASSERKTLAHVNERVILSLNTKTNPPLVIAFLEIFREMTKEGREEIILWINTFLNTTPSKHTGASGAIELLMKSMIMENRGIKMDSKREENVASAILLLRRGYTKVVHDGKVYEKPKE